MGKRFSHEGTVTVKDGGSWRKLGECVAWINIYDKEGETAEDREEREADIIEQIKSVSGVSTVDGAKTNFRAWNIKDQRRR